MEERNEMNKNDDLMLPGFRFHPTDEELVGFYLKRMILQRPLPIELIKQVDIYKYDPWDLPKLSTAGEKEWYFYCPRDRKYRNSVRPNRVTAAGFWKATGTDRPIYSSDGTNCIGLKKSLVFYRGKAAKGMKTDWMMHEFRLPPVSDLGPPKKLFDKHIPANDAWAICKIFKKPNSMAQRAALSHQWMLHQLPETTASDTQFSPENISCTTVQLCCNGDLQQQDISPCFSIPNGDPLQSNNLMLVPAAAVDDASILQSMQFEGQQQQRFNGFSFDLPHEMQHCVGTGGGGGLNDAYSGKDSDEGVVARSFGFPFSLSSDSSLCPPEMSTSYSTNKYYT